MKPKAAQPAAKSRSTAGTKVSSLQSGKPEVKPHRKKAPAKPPAESFNESTAAAAVELDPERVTRPQEHVPTRKDAHALGQEVQAKVEDPTDHTERFAGVSATINEMDRWIRAPSAVDSPAPTNVTEASAEVYGHGFSASAGRPIDPNGTRSEAVGLDVSRGGVEVTAARIERGASTGVEAFAMPGWVEAGVDRTWSTADGGAQTLNIFAAGWKDFAALGGSTRRTLEDGTTLRGGAYVAVIADRGVSDLGPVPGQNGEEQRRVELKKRTGGWTTLSGGVLTSLVGVGGRLVIDRSKDVVYRTNVSQEKARELLFDPADKGLVGFFRNKARALGAVEEKIALPDLSNPDSLAVGDELKVNTSGGVLSGVVLGHLLRASANAMVRGEFELFVRKVSPTQVELSITPTQVRSMHVYGDLGYVLEVNRDKLKAQSLRQAFSFDLSKPGALAAYQKALQGDLPNGLPNTLESVKKAPASAPALLEQVRREVLPAGVQRLYLERVETEATVAGGGLNWGPFDSVIGVTGLSAHKARGSERRVITDGNAALAVDTRGVEQRRRLLLSGTETTGVFASLGKVATADAQGNTTTEFTGLRLWARFTDDRSRGFELNGDVIERLNHALGTRIPPITQRSPGDRRRVEVERTLTAADFNKITHARPDQLFEVAMDTGVSEAKLTNFQRALSQAQGPEARAEVCQNLIADCGLSAFGALHRLAGGRDELTISTESSLYDDGPRIAQTLVFKYPRPVGLGDPDQAIRARYKEVRAALERLEQARQLLATDALVPAAPKAALDRRLEQAEAALLPLIDFSHLKPFERDQLVERLSMGWLGSVELELLWRLGEGSPEGLPRIGGGRDR